MNDEVSLTLMFNAQAPHIHFVLSAGQKIDIKVPGTYEVVPISLNKIVAGYSSYKNNVSEQGENNDVEGGLTNNQYNENIIEYGMSDNTVSDNQDIQAPSVISNSVLELNQPNTQEHIKEPVKGGNPINLLFTQNLSKLLVDTRYK